MVPCRRFGNPISCVEIRRVFGSGGDTVGGRLGLLYRALTFRVPGRCLSDQYDLVIYRPVECFLLSLRLSLLSVNGDHFAPGPRSEVLVGHVARIVPIVSPPRVFRPCRIGVTPGRFGVPPCQIVVPIF